MFSALLARSILLGTPARWRSEGVNGATQDRRSKALPERKRSEMAGIRGSEYVYHGGFRGPDLSEVAVRRPRTARPARMLGASVTVG